MANKVIGDYSAANTIDGSTHYLLIQPGSSSTAYNKINRNVFLGITGQPADISSTQSFTNKTFDNTNTFTVRDDRFTLQDNLDVTKQAVFQLSGITTATTRTYTLPNASSTLADISTAQTLTNKTLTSPTITGGSISNSTIAVDSIGEFTVNNGVTIDGLNIMNGALNTNNSVVTANITDSAVIPAKLQTGTGAGWSYQSYSPTLTNLTMGNGTMVSKYIQTGKTVEFYVLITFGTTTAITGTVTGTLPVTASASYSNRTPIGQANYSQAGNFNGAVWIASSTTFQPIVYVNDSVHIVSADVTASSPVSWNNTGGSQILLTAKYEAA